MRKQGQGIFRNDGTLVCHTWSVIQHSVCSVQLNVDLADIRQGVCPNQNSWSEKQ